MIKIPASVIINFLQSEVKEAEPTSDGKEWKINSIYTSDKKRKCYISPEKFQFMDFKSGESGSCYKLLKDMLDLKSNKEVLKYLMKNYSVGGEKVLFDLETHKEVKSQNNVIETFEMFDKPVFFFQKDKIGKYGIECLKYLNNRKISPEFIKNMGYVYNSNSQFHKRIIIPYMENYKLAYFQARSIDPKNTLRYLNPRGLDTKSFVFNYDNLNDDELIICEGPFDAMSMDEQTAMCMCSGDLSVKQIKKIFGKCKPKHIIYVPDNDETGMRKMDTNIQRIITYADYMPDILIFDVSKYGVKDLNEMKVKAGKNYILRSECEKYKRNRFRKFSFEE